MTDQQREANGVLQAALDGIRRELADARANQSTAATLLGKINETVIRMDERAATYATKLEVRPIELAMEAAHRRLDSYQTTVEGAEERLAGIERILTEQAAEQRATRRLIRLTWAVAVPLIPLVTAAVQALLKR